MSMEDLLESKKKMEKINGEKETKVKFRPVNPKKRKTFEEKYLRLTTYISHPLYRKIHALKDDGSIRTITDFMNEALEEHIKNHF